MSVGNRHKDTNASIANQHEPGRTGQIMDQWIGDSGAVLMKINSDGHITYNATISGNAIAGSSTSFVVTNVVTISAAEVQTLDVGKELVAAPGTHNVAEFVSLVLIYDFAGEAFNNGGALTVYNGSTAVSNTISAANSFGAAADKVAYCVALDTANGILLTENGALTLKAASAFGDGASHLATGVGRAYVTYRVHATGL